MSPWVFSAATWMSRWGWIVAVVLVLGIWVALLVSKNTEGPEEYMSTPGHVDAGQ